jgi:FkbM family methyltransferase
MARGIVRETLRLGWIRLHESSYWNYYKWKRGLAEPEIGLLPILCSKDKVSVDIGANIGLYSNALLCHSDRCIAFEPLPPMVSLLKQAFRRHGNRYIVEQVALSDAVGTASLRMPKGNFGYSTIESENVLDGKVSTKTIVTYEVGTRRLDDYALENVGFIKIDVEGHELSVLTGGLETLKRCRPAVLVEIEERHKRGAVHAAEKLMRDLGYECFFLKDGALHSFLEINLAVHQNSDDPKNYVRNFIFLYKDSDHRARIEAATANGPKY